MKKAVLNLRYLVAFVTMGALFFVFSCTSEKPQDTPDKAAKPAKTKADRVRAMKNGPIAGNLLYSIDFKNEKWFPKKDDKISVKIVDTSLVFDATEEKSKAIWAGKGNVKTIPQNLKKYTLAANKEYAVEVLGTTKARLLVWLLFFDENKRIGSHTVIITPRGVIRNHTFKTPAGVKYFRPGINVKTIGNGRIDKINIYEVK